MLNSTPIKWMEALNANIFWECSSRSTLLDFVKPGLWSCCSSRPVTHFQYWWYWDIFCWCLLSVCFSFFFSFSKGQYQSGYNATRFGIQLSNLFRVMFLQLGWRLCIVHWTVPFSDCLALWYDMTSYCFKPCATSCFKTLEPVTFWSQAHSWKNTMVLTTPPLLISNPSCAPASPFVSPDLQRASFTASTPIQTPAFSLLFTRTLPNITTFHTCSGVFWTIYFLVNTLPLPFKWPLLPSVYYTHQ